MATHSNILAMENSMDRGAGKAPAYRASYSPRGHKKSDMTEPLTLKKPNDPYNLTLL